MPRSSRYGHPVGELPRSLRRSCPEAQAVFLRASREALQAHCESEETYRIAYTALKQKFENRGDHWIAKAEAPEGGKAELCLVAAFRSGWSQACPS
jgi:hypothetical protein